MELVLNDEVGRAQQSLAVDGLRRRERVLAWVAVGVLELRRSKAVPLAATVDGAEERLRRPLPGQLGELVHRRDQERRQAPINLLIDSQYRQPFARRPALGELALPEAVAAEGEHARPALLVRFHAHVAPRLDRRPTPRA